MPIASAFTPVVPSGNPTTGFTVVIPAGAVAGVILEMSVTSRDSVNPALGPTISDNDSGGNAWAIVRQSADGKATTWWKRATGGTAGKTITIASALGSSTGVLQGFSGCAASGTPQTNVAEESNASGNETHAGFTPSQADSMVRAVVYNYGNDNAVTSLSFATLGATTMTEKLSTGGSDCACASGYKLQAGSAAATGNLTWAQTDGATYSHVWALKPLEEHSGTATLTGGGGITPVISTARSAAPSFSAGGGVTPTAATQRSAAQVLSAGGGIAPANTTSRAAVLALSAGGGVNQVSSTQRGAAPAPLTTGGGITPASSTQRGVLIGFSAGGGVACLGSTQRAAIPILTGGGLIVVEGLAEEGGGEEGEHHSGSALLTSGGAIAVVVRTARAIAALLTGGGELAGAGATSRSGSAQMSAGGEILSAGYNSTPIEYGPLAAQPPSSPRAFAAPEAPQAVASSSGFGKAFPDA